MTGSARMLGLVLAAALLAPAAAVGQTPTEHTLSVVGQGQVELRPDRGSFTVSVIRRSPTASTARSRANTRLAAIVKALRTLGIPREEIATTEVAVARTARRVAKGGPRRVRYRASVSLQVGVEGLDRLGRAIDAVTRRGATNVYGPDLSLSPALRTTGKQQAEAGALKDARARAEAVAAAEGQRIVGVQSIDLDPARSDEYSSGSGAAGGDGSSSAQTQILAGRITFTSDARVTYLIEPAS